VELNGVSLRYHRSAPWVLRGVSAAVGPGEAVLVTGRNGAGKSTLLQVLAGLLPTSRGTVDNRPEVIGFVPERFPTRQPFTALAYLEASGRVRGLSKQAAREAAEHWADRLNLSDYLGTRLGELSKGSAQKVGIAQALLVPPTLLVLDEPWEGLDAQARDELPGIIGEITDAGGFCVFSDHRGEAGELAGVRRWILDDGLLSEPEAATAGRHIIEVVVAASESAAAIAKLRAAGHEVRAVRREQIRDLGGAGEVESVPVLADDEPSDEPSGESSGGSEPVPAVETAGDRELVAAESSAAISPATPPVRRPAARKRKPKGPTA
jgi:ABC-type multidrug transport system ATPase subunit